MEREFKIGQWFEDPGHIVYEITGVYKDKIRFKPITTKQSFDYHRDIVEENFNNKDWKFVTKPTRNITKKDILRLMSNLNNLISNLEVGDKFSESGLHTIYNEWKSKLISNE